MEVYLNFTCTCLTLCRWLNENTAMYSELDVHQCPPASSFLQVPIFCRCFLTAEFGWGVSVSGVSPGETGVHFMQCLGCFCNPVLGSQSSTRCHCCCLLAQTSWPFLQQKFWVVSVNMSIHVTPFCDGKMSEAALVSVIKNKCKS